MPAPTAKLPPFVLSRTGSTTVATRVTLAAAEALRQHAAACGANQAVILRRLIHSALSQKGDNADALASIVELLGLDPEVADKDSILAAVEALLDADGADLPEGFDPGADPLSGDAEPKPPKAPAALAKPAPAAPAVQLTAAQVTALAKRKMPITLAAWKQLCANTVRNYGRPIAAAAPKPRALSNADVSGFSDAERAYMKKHSLSREEFLARKAATVKLHKAPK